MENIFFYKELEIADQFLGTDFGYSFNMRNNNYFLLIVLGQISIDELYEFDIMNNGVSINNEFYKVEENQLFSVFNNYKEALIIDNAEYENILTHSVDEINFKRISI
jgi:hypothetical protein